MSAIISGRKQAHFIKDMDGFTGAAKLYRCDPPMRTEDGEVAEYVVVSATTNIWSGPETYIFPADADGKVTDWGELSGSFRGAQDHVKALRGAGYEMRHAG